MEGGEKDAVPFESNSHEIPHNERGEQSSAGRTSGMVGNPTGEVLLRRDETMHLEDRGVSRRQVQSDFAEYFVAEALPPENVLSQQVAEEFSNCTRTRSVAMGICGTSRLLPPALSAIRAFPSAPSLRDSSSTPERPARRSRYLAPLLADFRPVRADVVYC
ncbi:MAG TPA: hypothetical protein VGR62_15130 [Candidatus Binatia bacterium]|jgi:hypothetical protein|nr:hypothetical protein [Candidatus Binatia bacterium]